MRDDQPSSTASIVCAARAETARRPTIRGFEEPFAERLLPPGYAIHDGAGWQRRAARLVRRVLRGGVHVIGLRTVAIDDGIRTAPSLQQLVILGAGLDARAWRMPELAELPVFEVDHESTQRYKRERAAAFADLPYHHYVSVDFERDSLADRLHEAGHRADLPTVWVWEGVTMYLHPAAVEGTVSVLADRSAPQSRLLVTYLPSSVARTLIGVGTSIVGEGFRASYEPPEMAALLAKHGFEVVRDESAEQWHARWALDGVSLMRGFGRTERLATADTPG